MMLRTANRIDASAHTPTNTETHPMTPRILALIPASLIALAGCGSPAKYIETGSPQSVVSVGDTTERLNKLKTFC